MQRTRPGGLHVYIAKAAQRPIDASFDIRLGTTGFRHPTTLQQAKLPAHIYMDITYW
jgi:hypothetical protein